VGGWAKRKPQFFCMETDEAKPPWQTIDFQSSPSLESAMIETLQGIQFDTTWKEMDHQELTMIKEKIEPLEKIHKWELLKKKSNPYELVYTHDSSDCPSSVCILKPLSRSYFKMIEMLQVSQFFERLPKGTQKLRSSHVAEGPGGFIEAFLDRTEGNRQTAQKSYAITLKPVNNHIPGWRRSHQFLQRHPEVKIHYGADGTGDIYISENQESFIKLHDPLKSHLFTGDGGFDFSSDYENQEKSVYPLLIASSLIGLQVLLPEGTFVLKLFDAYSSVTQHIIRCISLCFKEWSLYKPATSRPCNSERYLICRGFKKAHPPILQHLHRLQVQWRDSQMYPNTEFFSLFTQAETEYFQRHISQFQQKQLENIQSTLGIQSLEPSKYDWTDQYKKAFQWCSQFHVPGMKRTK
jgi:hypothetical protein